MSVSFSIICKDCKKYLWIGQSSDTFYSGEEHTMEALRVFLFDHIGHNLTYDAPEYHEKMSGDDWEEIDAYKYKKQHNL